MFVHQLAKELDADVFFLHIGESLESSPHGAIQFDESINITLGATLNPAKTTLHIVMSKGQELKASFETAGNEEVSYLGSNRSIPTQHPIASGRRDRRTYTCRHTDYRSKEMSGSAYKTHLVTEHQDNRSPWYCSECELGFVFPKRLAVHVRAIPTPVPCTIYDGFNGEVGNPEERKIHIPRHYICPYCAMSFPTTRMGQVRPGMQSACQQHEEWCRVNGPRGGDAPMFATLDMVKDYSVPLTATQTFLYDRRGQLRTTAQLNNVRKNIKAVKQGLMDMFTAHHVSRGEWVKNKASDIDADSEIDDEDFEELRDLEGEAELNDGYGEETDDEL